MKAVLLYKHKVVTETSITEFVIWGLPDKTLDRPHGIKYRLYHGTKEGRCIVRFDNESGKSDHKHIGNKEMTYKFTSVERLIQDFMFDVERLTEEENNDE